jgi:hypothetical protein
MIGPGGGMGTGGEESGKAPPPLGEAEELGIPAAISMYSSPSTRLRRALLKRLRHLRRQGGVQVGLRGAGRGLRLRRGRSAPGGCVSANRGGTQVVAGPQALMRLH